jgi:hypothetical protein
LGCFAAIRAASHDDQAPPSIAQVFGRADCGRPVEDLGPCMLALTPKQRAFVMELRAGPAGYGSEVRACRAAGYGANSSDGATRVIAHNVLHNPKVQEALREVGVRIIRAEAFQSIKNTAAIANDREHRDCLKANLALLDRGGFAVETVHHVTVERSQEMIVIATDEVIERIRQLAMKAGLDPAKQVKQIEAVANKAPE